MPTALAPLVRQVEARARRVLDALLEAPTVPQEHLNVSPPAN